VDESKNKDPEHERQLELNGPEQVEHEESQLKHFGVGREAGYYPESHVATHVLVDICR